MLIICQGNCWF